jgi:hypothetical protein
MRSDGCAGAQAHPVDKRVDPSFGRAATWGWGASPFPACFSFCVTYSGDEITTEPHRRIDSEPSQMQGCDKRNRRDSGLPPDLTILLRISVEPTATVR